MHLQAELSDLALALEAASLAVACRGMFTKPSVRPARPPQHLLHKSALHGFTLMVMSLRCTDVHMPL